MKIQKPSDITVVTTDTINAYINPILGSIRCRNIDQDNFIGTGVYASVANDITDISDVPVSSKPMVGQYMLEQSYDTVLDDIQANFSKSCSMINEDIIIRDVSIVRSFTINTFDIKSPKTQENGFSLSKITEGVKDAVSSVASYKKIKKTLGFSTGKNKKKAFAKKGTKSRLKEEIEIVEKPKGCILDDISYCGDVYCGAAKDDKSKAKFIVTIDSETEDYIKFKLCTIFTSALADTEFINVEYRLQLKFRRIV
jgi:hypothetical protein